MAAGAVSFLELVGKLKTERRTGWVNSGVDAPESVADHMYRMAVCALLLGMDAAECGHLAQLSLVHDMAEALVGDIVPSDTRYTREEKHRLEAAALTSMLTTLRGGEGGGGLPSAADRIAALYAEYEAQATPSARLVKDVDLLDMALQAHEYERRQPELDLAGFFSSVRGR